MSCCQPPASSIAARRQMPAVPLKLKNRPAVVAHLVLDHEVAVEQRRLGAREQALVAVRVLPARLHHADRADRRSAATSAQQEVGSGTKSASKMQNSSPCAVHAVLERAGLEAGAVGAAQHLGVEPARAQARDLLVDDRARLVGRVVEHLDLEPVGRIVERARRADQARATVRSLKSGSWTVTRGQKSPSTGPGAARTPQRKRVTSRSRCSP